MNLPVPAGVCLFAGLALLLRLTPPWEVNHDVGWFLYLAERVWAGDRLYADIVDVNPPLIVYLTLPPVVVAGWTGLPAVPVFDAFVLGILGLAAWGLRGVASDPWARAAVFLLFAVVPGADFGQREHLAVILALPYFTLIAARLAGEAVARRPALAWGALAGLGFAIKPHFLLAPLCVHAGIAIARRRLAVALTAENGALLAVVAAYAAHLLVVPFRGAFLEHVALVREVYGAYRIGAAEFFARPWVGRAIGAAGVVGLLAVLAGSRRPAARGVLVVLLLAQIGFFAGAAWQGKGWSYQVLPVLLCGACGVVVAAFAWARTPVLRVLVALALLGCGVLPLGQHWLERDPVRGTARVASPFTGVPDEFATVRELGRGDSVLILDTEMHTFFAHLRDRGIRWASRHACLWVLPGAGPARRAALRREVTADLRRHRPDLVYVRKGVPRFVADAGFDLLSWLRADPAAVRVLAEYDLAGATDRFLEFRRRGR